jgi:CheY-like chemotaxis protein
VAKKILVIEDEEELGGSLKKFLEQHHYQVTYFNDLTHIQSINVENPDLILTDLLMPHLHGFDICKAVKADPDLKDIPLMVMSAVYKDSFHRLEARRLGVEEFIEKPFKFSDLLKRIEGLLGTDSPESSSPAAENSPPVEEQAESEPMADGSGWKIRTAAWANHQSPKAMTPDTLPEEDDVPASMETSVAVTSTEETTGPGPVEEAERDEQILEQLQEMQQDYATRLPEKILALEQSWQRLQSRESGKELQKQLEEFRRKVHNLRGSGTTFGFKEIGEGAAEMEMLVDKILGEGLKTISTRQNRMNELLDNMRHHPLISTELEVLRHMRK